MTRITKMNTDSNNVSALAVKSPRKEDISANANRVNWRLKSDKFHGSLKKNHNNNIVNHALKEHEDLLKFIDPILKLLKSKTVTPPAKDLASLVLSASVLQKNALKKLSQMINFDNILNYIPSNFKA